MNTTGTALCVATRRLYLERRIWRKMQGALVAERESISEQPVAEQFSNSKTFEVKSIKDFAGAMAYQNSGLIARFAKRHKVTLEETQRLFEETKKFLVICGAMKVSCSPSDKLDEMWHHFILHTKDYQMFCDNFIGRFIHHNPTETPFVGARKQMIEFAEKTFGSIDRSIWPDASITACGSSCSGDSYCDDGGS